MNEERDTSIAPPRVPAPDTRVIELETRGELEYWLKVFDTSADELMAAISHVGPYAGAVAIHLKSVAAARTARAAE
jgi:hypothetical protein